jgi:hypothetical protein
VPRGDTRLLPGDEVLVLVTDESIDEVREILTTRSGAGSRVDTVAQPADVGGVVADDALVTAQPEPPVEAPVGNGDSVTPPAPADAAGEDVPDRSA